MCTVPGNTLLVLSHGHDVHSQTVHMIGVWWSGEMAGIDGLVSTGFRVYLSRPNVKRTPEHTVEYVKAHGRFRAVK